MIRLDPATRYWCVMADGIDGNLDRVLHELIASVEELATHGPTEEAVEKLGALRGLARATPDHLVNHLDNSARRHLFGLEPYTLSEADEEADCITADSVHAELEGLLSTALAFGPPLGSGAPEGWTRYASWERGQVPGRRLEPITGREQGSLIAGSRGVTKRFEGNWLSVRWQEIEACVVEGAALHLVDGSGTVVTVNPAHWRGGEYVSQLVRDHVAPSKIIHLLRGAHAFATRTATGTAARTRTGWRPSRESLRSAYPTSARARSAW